MSRSVSRTSGLPYSKTGTTILEGLLDGLEAQLLTSPEKVTLEQLSKTGWDEFHVGGGVATLHAVAKLDIQPGDRILDVGCGVGGPARRVALKYPESTVVGVDITPEYISVGKAVNSWPKIKAALGGRIELIEGDVTKMSKIPNSSIDKAYCIHVGMNIKDKERLAKELYRVLKPGGRFVFFEQMANPTLVMPSGWGNWAVCACTGNNRAPTEDVNRRLSYPLPWAYGPEVSFCATPQAYKFAFEDAGLVSLPSFEEDRSEEALEFFNDTQRQMMWHFFTGMTLYPPPLGLHLILGNDFKSKISNYKAALSNELLVVMELAFAKPFEK